LDSYVHAKNEIVANVARNGVTIMSEPVVLRTVKMGGFNKEDVLQYVDELNSKIVVLEEENKKNASTGPADPKEIQRYREQIDNLQKKLNESNNALRAAKTENEQLKAQLASKPGAPAPAAPAANPDAAAELAKLRDAHNKARIEIDRLTHALTAAQAQLKNAQMQAQQAQQVKSAASAQTAVNTAEKDAEIAKMSSQLTSTASELKAKIDVLTDKEKELAELQKELESKIKLISDKDSALKDKESALKDKESEISKLNAEITELKENENAGIAPSFDMGALFTEAQKTARKITIEAKVAADKLTKEASDQARALVDEATAEAQRTIDSAGVIAETHIKEAKEKARADFYDSYKRAESLNAASDAIKDMLNNEIDSVSIKLNDISSLIEKVTNQASVRMNEAKNIVEEARKTINAKKKKVDLSSFEAAEAIKRTAVPVAEEKSAKITPPHVPTAAFEEKPVQKVTPPPALVPTPAPKEEEPKIMDFDDLSTDFSFPSVSPASKSAQRPVQTEKPKSVSSFSFDMSELLKAAEAEASMGDQI